MKKILITFIAAFTACICNAQLFSNRDFRQFPHLTSVVVANVPTPVPTSNNDYLIALPRESRMIIAFNDDSTKAKVIHDGRPNFPRNRYKKNLAYNVKDNARRLVLYYQDSKLYCGYIYDKQSKAVQYFNASNLIELNEVSRHLPFIQFIPTVKFRDEEKRLEK